MNYQKLQKGYKSEFDIAKMYYSIVSELYQLNLTKRELELIAFSATKGTISTPPVRDEFMKQFKVPKGSIYNIVSKLQKSGILIKDDNNKVRINPKIHPDFSQKDFLIAIKLEINGD